MGMACWQSSATLVPYHRSLLIEDDIAKKEKDIAELNNTISQMEQIKDYPLYPSIKTLQEKISKRKNVSGKGQERAIERIRNHIADLEKITSMKKELTNYHEELEELKKKKEQKEEEEAKIKEEKVRLQPRVTDWMKKSTTDNMRLPTGDIRRMLSTLHAIFPHFEPKGKYSVKGNKIKQQYYKATKLLH